MTQQPDRPSMDDDIDDIMASIMHGKAASQNNTSGARSIRLFKKEKTPRPLKKPKPPLQQATVQAPKHPVKKQKKHWQTPSFKKLKYFLIVPACIALLAGAVYFLQGPVTSLIRPKSPFSQEIIEDAGIPLYYPSNLPGSFKIELDSISRPEESVVVYAMSDDNGQRINISIQKKPEQFNLEPLYNVLTGLRDITTKFGSVRVGNNEGTTTIVNIISDQTWIIINYPIDTIDDDALIRMIDSLAA